MTGPLPARAVALRINEAALRGGWSWTGWVALNRHGLLGRDVRQGEPLELLVPPADLADAGDIVVGTLAAEGWNAVTAATAGEDRTVTVTHPPAVASTSVLLRAATHLDPVHVDGWPCVSVETLALAAAVRIALCPTACRVVRHAATIDLLLTVRALDDVGLARLVRELPDAPRGVLAGAARGLPAWMITARTTRARDLVEARRRLLVALDHRGQGCELAAVRLSGVGAGDVVVDDLLVATLVGRRRIPRGDTPLLARTVQWAVWEGRPEVLTQLTGDDLARVWPSLTLTADEREGLASLGATS